MKVSLICHVWWKERGGENRKEKDGYGFDGEKKMRGNGEIGWYDAKNQKENRDNWLFMKKRLILVGERVVMWISREGSSWYEEAERTMGISDEERERKAKNWG